jgi:hypothetical protein
LPQSDTEVDVATGAGRNLASNREGAGSKWGIMVAAVSKILSRESGGKVGALVDMNQSELRIIHITHSTCIGRDKSLGDEKHGCLAGCTIERIDTENGLALLPVET